MAPDDDALGDHVAACPVCRAGLESLAGDPTWWEDARQALTCPNPEVTRRIISSVCALSAIPVEQSKDVALLDHELEQLRPLLNPACHPELIGSLGRYELEQLVGRGGMGLVFRAFDTELHRIVAVKTLAIHLIPISSARERFVREARASASLVHPHIVPVHDVITDDPVPAIVMQYIAGPTLEQWLEEQGPMDWKQALSIGNQLADALNAAHKKGLVHRDVKPGNVLLEADGSRALLSDFGLVRALDDATLTRSGILAGTPDYMSPEQAHGKPVEHTSDLFSLGALMYAMLTGKPPFQAAGPMAIMNKVCHEKHPSITTAANIPPNVVRLVDRLLAKDPSRRPPSAQQVAEQIRKLIVAKHRQQPHWLLSSEHWMRVAALAVTLCIVTLFIAVCIWQFMLQGKVNSQPSDRRAASVRNDATGELVGSTSQSKTARDEAASMVDHQVLDQQLREVRQKADRMLDALSFPSPGVKHEPWDASQVHINSVSNSLKQLEQEILGRKTLD